MRSEMYQGFSDSQFQGFGSVRSPIQCQGIDRGHRRMAEVAVCGSVDPQNLWGTLGSIGSTLLKTAPTWAPLLASL